MKLFYSSVIALLIIFLIAGCSGKRSSGKQASSEADTISVPDTGFTGIKKYYSNNRLIKEVTFRNSIRQGEMKTYYAGGQLFQTFWYENGLREDSSRYYYLEGQVFRATPYKHDTIDGVQVQYYRTGKVKARIRFIKGLRAPDLQEYTSDGRPVRGYPEIIYNLTDNYNTAGRVKVDLELSNKSTRVKFYRGEFTGGVFDTTRCVRINTIDGKAVVNLRKTSSPQQDYLGVIGVITTDFGNKYLAYKKIELPYKDLK